MSAPQSFTLVATIRDFTPDHPDFERSDIPVPAGQIVRNMVKETLAIEPSDGLPKPIYTDGPTPALSSGKANFDKWYRGSDPRSTMKLPLIFNLDPSTNTYVFDSDIDEPYKSLGGFFPIDKQLLDISGEGSGEDNNGNSHNFHFTLELHFRFTYEQGKGKVFKFRGDDDLWVFFNGKRLIDLGGVHARAEASINIDDHRVALGLVDKQLCSVSLFYAERHTTESNLRIETTLAILPTVSIEATKPDARKFGPGSTIAAPVPVAGEFTITLDQPAPAGGMVITYGLNEAPAVQKFAGQRVGKMPPASVENTDFTLENILPGSAVRSVTIAAGKQTATIKVNPKGLPPLGTSEGSVVVALKPDTAPTPRYQLGNDMDMVRIADQRFWTAQIVPNGDADKPTRKQGGFKVLSDFPAPAGGLTIRYELVPGVANGAVENTDFVTLPKTVTIAAGQKEALIPVTPLASKNLDEKKPLSVRLVSGANYQPDPTPGKATATIQIIDRKVPTPTPTPTQPPNPVVIPHVYIVAGPNARRPTNHSDAINSFFTIKCDSKPANASFVITCDMNPTPVDGLYTLGSNTVTITVPAGQTSFSYNIPLLPQPGRAFRNSPITVTATLRDPAASNPPKCTFGPPASLMILPGPATDPGR